MHDVAEKSGRTVLFVSHQMSAVEGLCSRGIVLRNGGVVFDGTSKRAIREYLTDLETATASIDIRSLPRSGNGAIRLTAFALQNAEGKSASSALSGEDVDFVLDYEQSTHTGPRDVSVGISIHDHRGEMLTVFYSDYVGHHFESLPTRGRFVCTIPDFPFSQGRYYVGARVLVGGVEADWPKQMLGSVSVEAGDFYGNGSVCPHGIGPVLLRGTWRFLPSEVDA